PSAEVAKNCSVTTPSASKNSGSDVAPAPAAEVTAPFGLANLPQEIRGPVRSGHDSGCAAGSFEPSGPGG
ncbi:hypothetical protein ACWDOP_18945, partial [Nocardia sp. NPDC003693]